jgi:hypothetical protein
MLFIQDSTKVIGYFAINSEGQVLCEGNACVIAGDELSMNHYIHSIFKAQGAFSIRKTRFGEIFQGMSLGAPYAFDIQAYQRFSPIAAQHGITPTYPPQPIDQKNSPQFIVIQPPQQ